MLHFLTGVYNSLFSTPEYNVLIVGRESAGKSTLLEQLKFLYTPATQQREAEAISHLNSQQQQQAPLSADRSSSNGDAKAIHERVNTVADSSTTSAQQHQQRKQLLPPGTLLPATAVHLAQKGIRPTVGLNYAVVQHSFSPLVVTVTLKKPQLSSQTVASLPLPPKDLLAEQRAHQQAVMAKAPSDAFTRVVLRDLGGQTALRDLWEKYYAQSQGIVYVIDSTLPFRVLRESPASPLRDHFTQHELKEVYKQDRELLARLLQHPLLHNVPMLLLSNKTDEVSHISLATLQEALQLVELAANPTFYVLQNSGDGGNPSGVLGSQQRLHGSSSGDSTPLSHLSDAAAPPVGTSPSRYCTRSEVAQLRVGRSGFGKITMRVVEVSALDGVGVAGAMDWLVAQLLHRARDVDDDA
nr:unnamed protein product [Leishmania braziliensis]